MARRSTLDMSSRDLSKTAKRTGGRHRVRVLLLACVVVLMAAGCYNSTSGDTEVYGIAEFKLPVLPKTGSHKVMVFNEMHYQPSYRSQEGPRISPPPDSVPRTGREPRYASLEEYMPLQIPTNFRNTYELAKAKELYRVNCLVCHGSQMRGDGPIVKIMTKGPMPADLTSSLTADANDGELFAFVSNGGRQGYSAIQRGKDSASPMPSFMNLLTEEERWWLVMYLRSEP